MNPLLKGHITKTSEGGTRAQVQAFKNQTFNVLSLMPYGMASNIESDETSDIFMMKSLGSSAGTYPVNIISAGQTKVNA